MGDIEYIWLGIFGSIALVTSFLMLQYISKRSRTRVKSFTSPKFWISVLLGLLIILNAVMFLIYQKSHPDESLWIQLWNYSKSDTFKYLTISVVLPIILFLLEPFFKIREVIEKRIEAEKEKGRKARWECIEETSKIWNELYGLVSDVVYYKPPGKQNTEEKQSEKGTHIEDILKKLENLASSWNRIVNMWHYRFKNLSATNKGSSFENHVLYLINILYDSTYTIACYIQKETKKTSDLQRVLHIIQDAVKSIVYHPMMSVLKDSAYLMDEDSRKGEIQENLESWLEYLHNAADAIRRRELRENKVFSNIKDDLSGELQNNFQSLEKYTSEHPEETLTELLNSKEGSAFLDTFEKIELESFARARGSFYHSREWTEYLAKYLILVNALDKLDERAKWMGVAGDTSKLK